MEPNPIKVCLECGTKLQGRIDKKYCSDGCRIAYNNKLNSHGTNYVRNITNILRRNRRILESLNPTGKTKIGRRQLIAKGFDFNYLTSLYTTREGSVYKYCFEQGYLELDEHSILLVVKKDS